MQITVLSTTPERVSFKIKGVNFAFVNALRRAALTEIPTLAIEEVRITKNSSPLYDQVLAHRLGLLPWIYDDELFEKGRTRNFVFVLKAKGPKKVSAKDVVPPNGITAKYPDALLFPLTEGEEVELEADAIFGTGKDHAKWQAAVVGYEQEKEDEFTFTIESISGYAPKEIMDKAVKTLQERIDGFEKSI